VIKQNENRLPKWKFKFAPDLAAQIQSRITRAHVLYQVPLIRTRAPNGAIRWT
jgi:hypothetical protein